MSTSDIRSLCARFKRRQPDLCSPAIYEATCDCGKVYRRCANHGATEGAIKSRASHRGLEHPATTPESHISSPAPCAGCLPADGDYGDGPPPMVLGRHVEGCNGTATTERKEP